MPRMNPPNPPPDEDPLLDEIFGALADAHRRKILQLLRQAGELRVTDIAAAFDMSLNGVSKHLKVLEKAGLVHRHVRGREHWLTPSPERLSPALRYFHLIEHFWHGRLNSMAQALDREIFHSNQQSKDPENE